MSKVKNQTGFTILELMIATAVFSVLLAVCMTAFLQVGRMFVKGVNLSLTQEDTRNILDSISGDIRFSGQTPDLSNLSSGYFCVGQHRYKFSLFKQVGDPDTPYGLVRQNLSGGCIAPSAQDGATDPIEMLNNGMQLNKLDVTCVAQSCDIAINVIFYGGDASVLAPNARDPDARCKGSKTGSQFCATAAG